MKIKYYPGKYIDNIPLVVTKNISNYRREDSLLEIEVSGKEEPDTIDLDNVRGIQGKRIRQWSVIGSYGILEILFLVSLISVFQREFSLYTVYLVVMGLFLVLFIAFMIRSNIEKYMYGGFTCQLGEVYFQSNEEREAFNDVMDGKGKKKIERRNNL